MKKLNDNGMKNLIRFPDTLGGVSYRRQTVYIDDHGQTFVMRHKYRVNVEQRGDGSYPMFTPSERILVYTELPGSGVEQKWDFFSLDHARDFIGRYNHDARLSVASYLNGEAIIL